MIKYILLLLFSIYAFASEISDPFPVESVKYASLSNDMRVVVKENHAVPIVAVSVIIRAGSGISDSRGIPHYLEHLSFQGTQKYPVPLSAQYLIEEKGGYCTGATNRDSTRFEGVIPANQIDLMLSVLSQVTLHPLLTDTNFERERPTILAEIQRYNDDPVINVLNSAYYLAYRNHPYRNPTTGTIQDILMLRGNEIRDFHKRWYQPANMSLVVVGDVNIHDILESAEKYFATDDKTFVPPPVMKMQDQTCGQFSSINPNDTEIWQAFAWPTPAANDFAGCATTDVLMTMLTTGNTALINKWFSDANITVISAGGEYITSNYPGRLIIWIHTSKKDAENAKKQILQGFNSLSINVPIDIMEKAKTKVKSELLMNNETFARQSATLAIYQSMNTGEYTLHDYNKQIDAVTIQQIARIATAQPIAIVAKGGGR